jgi:soluble lytic murein transglycosylase-like protein
MVEQYAWDVQIVMAIMQAENKSCNPNINNAGLNYDGSVDYGLFQVNSIHSGMVGGNLDTLYDPATNISVAHKIYTGSGWTAWSTYNNGKYLSFL